MRSGRHARPRLVRPVAVEAGRPRVGVLRRGWFWAIAALMLVVAVMGVVYWRVNQMPPSDYAGQEPPAGSAAPNAVKPAPPANPSTGAVDNLDLVRRYVNEGNDLLSQGKSDEAIQRYQQALELQPDDEDAHFNLGIACVRSQRFEDALRHYSEAIRIMPQYVEAHNNLGNLLASLGRLDEAIGHFKTALQLMPQHASAHNNLGTALARQGKIDEAIPCFNEAIRLQPDYAEAYVNLGMSLLNRGRTNEALQNLETALKHRPGFAPAQMVLQRARGLTNLPPPTRP